MPGTAQHEAARIDPRNHMAGPRQRAFRWYVVLVAGVGLSVLVTALEAADLARLPRVGTAFWVVVLLLVVGDARPLFIPGSRDANGVVLSTAFVFALLLRYDLGVALAAQTLAVVISDLGRRKALWRTMFNVSQYALTWMCAWLVLVALGGTGSLERPAELSGSLLLHGLLAGLTVFVVNDVLVSKAVALRTGVCVTQVLREDLGFQLVTTAALLALGPLVVLAMQAGPGFVPLLVPPMAAVYAAGAAGVRSEQQALSDALTGLANRKRLKARVHEGPVALVLLDLDLFKQVNDTLGHHVGDQLLVAVAQRLLSCVRPHDLVARLGGDEFALVLDGGDVHGALRAAERARAVLSAPFSLGGLLVEVAASAGIAVSPQHGDDLDELLQRADVAMYLSKESGEVEVYDAGRDPNTPGRLVLLGALRRAVECDELVLHYQPKADLATGQVVGLEALVRWQHPQLGLVMPQDFIPMADRSGLIAVMTAQLLDSALGQLAAWRSRGWALDVAVNITVKDLCSDGFVGRVSACLDRYGLPPSALQLELTEGSLFAESAPARAALTQLQELGVGLSLDDFGTGWSSLGQLRRLPVSEIKVDRTFVARMAEDPRDRAIVTAVVDLARGLGVRVVAEGVEDQRTWDLLAGLGCHRAQGWVLAPALPPEELEAWLEARLTSYAGS